MTTIWRMGERRKKREEREKEEIWEREREIERRGKMMRMEKKDEGRRRGMPSSSFLKEVAWSRTFIAKKLLSKTSLSLSFLSIFSLSLFFLTFLVPCSGVFFNLRNLSSLPYINERERGRDYESKEEKETRVEKEEGGERIFREGGEARSSLSLSLRFLFESFRVNCSGYDDIGLKWARRVSLSLSLSFFYSLTGKLREKIKKRRENWVRERREKKMMVIYWVGEGERFIEWFSLVASSSLFFHDYLLKNHHLFSFLRLISQSVNLKPLLFHSSSLSLYDFLSTIFFLSLSLCKVWLKNGQGQSCYLWVSLL